MAKKDLYSDTKHNKKRREDFMTDDEIMFINDCLSKIIERKGDMNELYAEWQEIEAYCQNEQSNITNMPNTKINLMNANIEGQCAMIVEQDLAVMTRGESAGDEEYAEDSRIGLEWTLRKNYFKKVMKAYARRLVKFGNSFFSVCFDPEALSKFGLVKIFPVQMTRIFVDGKIKDPLLLQDAEYIAEVLVLSKTQFEDIYGEDKANAVMYGKPNDVEDSTVFDIDDSNDDDDAATLIKWWCRHKGKLRLVEFTGCGLLMYDSHKEGTRKDNQKNKKYNHKSYYKYVNDKYPYFLTVLYTREGNLFGYGDGKLLLPLQKLINELYDKIRICARPNLILYDTNADMSLDDFDENSLEPRPFDGTQTQDPVKAVPWGTINESWWRLLSAIHEEAQRVSRFSELMTGNQKGADTATEAAIQQQQGNMSTDDKKGMIQTTLIETLEYVLGLMMEFYTEGRSFRTSEDDASYKWIDFRNMANVPVKIPATQEYVDDYLKENPESPTPLWQLLTGKNGEPLTKNVDLDIEVNIGAGLPKNKAFITKFIQDIAAVSLPDQQGMVKPAIFWDELREFLKKFVGLPLKDNDELMGMMQQVMPGMPQPGMPGMEQMPQQPMISPDAMGLGAGGSPQMGQLSDMRGGQMGGVA